MSDITGIISRDTFLNPKRFIQNIFKEDDGQKFFSDSEENYCFHCSSKENISIIDNQYILAIDGYVCNIQEVLKDLENDDIDTLNISIADSLLKYYVKYGIDFINKISGSYVIILLDKNEEQVFLISDPIGQKQLYYGWKNDSLWFSTNLMKIIPFIKNKLSWDEEAIQSYFRLGFIPAPKTIFNEIRKLKGGTYIKFKEPHPVFKEYWILEKQVKETTLNDKVKAKKELKELIENSVSNCLTDDTGAFLSGGIDSSLITAVAQSQASKPISTFSIGFKESSHNESEYAKEVANRLKTNHHELILNENDALELVSEIPKWYGEPYADSSALPSYLATKLASQHVKTILTGDGGDELFLGYGKYIWANRLEKYKTVRNILKTALSLSPIKNHNRTSNYFNYNKEDNLLFHVFSVEHGFFTHKELYHCFNFHENFIPFKSQPINRNLSVIEKQAIFDLKYYLPGDLAVKINRVAAQFNLETKAPLLNPKIVEWSLNLDENLKLNNGEAKYLLKEVLYDYLPKSLFDRPKWGFGVPLDKWLQNELRPLLDAYVNRETLEKYPFYNVNQILKIKEDFLNGKTYAYNKLWLVIIFNMWGEKIKQM